MTVGVAVLEEPALVLNRHWVPIHLTTARHAIELLYQEVARAVNPDDGSLHRFQSWTDLRIPEDSPTINTPTLRIPVPEIMVLERYGRVPKRTVPFNRRNLFVRDRNRCQYCGTKMEPGEITIDHVLPRVQGGLSSWANCVLACIPCNRRKAHRTPGQARMHLRRSPTRPQWTPKLLFTGLPRRASWGRIIGEAYWSVDLDA